MGGQHGRRRRVGQGFFQSRIILPGIYITNIAHLGEDIFLAVHRSFGVGTERGIISGGGRQTGKQRCLRQRKFAS